MKNDTIRVLVVDDDADEILSVAADLLEFNNTSILSGKIAVEATNSAYYAIILLDEGSEWDVIIADCYMYPLSKVSKYALDKIGKKSQLKSGEDTLVYYDYPCKSGSPNTADGGFAIASYLAASSISPKPVLVLISSQFVANDRSNAENLRCRYPCWFDFHSKVDENAERDKRQFFQWVLLRAIKQAKHSREGGPVVELTPPDFVMASMQRREIFDSLTQAMATGRVFLLRGGPGTGKRTLAHAMSGMNSFRYEHLSIFSPDFPDKLQHECTKQKQLIYIPDIESANNAQVAAIVEVISSIVNKSINPDDCILVFSTQHANNRLPQHISDRLQKVFQLPEFQAIPDDVVGIAKNILDAFKWLDTDTDIYSWLGAARSWPKNGHDLRACLNTTVQCAITSGRINSAAIRGIYQQIVNASTDSSRNAGCGSDAKNVEGGMPLKNHVQSETSDMFFSVLVDSDSYDFKFSSPARRWDVYKNKEKIRSLGDLDGLHYLYLIIKASSIISSDQLYEARHPRSSPSGVSVAECAEEGLLMPVDLSTTADSIRPDDKAIAQYIQRISYIDKALINTNLNEQYRQELIEERDIIYKALNHGRRSHVDSMARIAVGQTIKTAFLRLSTFTELKPLVDHLEKHIRPFASRRSYTFKK